jgi:hypothetical protein
MELNSQLHTQAALPLQKEFPPSWIGPIAVLNMINENKNSVPARNQTII